MTITMAAAHAARRSEGAPVRVGQAGSPAARAITLARSVLRSAVAARAFGGEPANSVHSNDLSDSPCRPP
jgi:hypothetical protein